MVVTDMRSLRKKTYQKSSILLILAFIHINDVSLPRLQQLETEHVELAPIEGEVLLHMAHSVQKLRQRLVVRRDERKRDFLYLPGTVACRFLVRPQVEFEVCIETKSDKRPIADEDADKDSLSRGAPEGA